MRQLFHLGLIEAYSGVISVKKPENEIEPIDGQLIDEASDDLGKAIEELELSPASHEKDGSLNVECMMKFEDQEPQPAGCIPWCPPMPSWNPWTGSNIDEGENSKYFFKRSKNENCPFMYQI